MQRRNSTGSMDGGSSRKSSHSKGNASGGTDAPSTSSLSLSSSSSSSSFSFSLISLSLSLPPKVLYRAVNFSSPLRSSLSLSLSLSLARALSLARSLACARSRSLAFAHHVPAKTESTLSVQWAIIVTSHFTLTHTDCDCDCVGLEMNNMTYAINKDDDASAIMRMETRAIVRMHLINID